MSQEYRYQPNVPYREDLSKSPDLLKNLSLADVPKPVPGPNEALVRIRAVSLNARDLIVMAGDMRLGGAATGLIPCSDGVGEVEQIGSGSSFRVGDHVMLMLHNWSKGTDPRDLDFTTLLGGGNTHGTLRQYAVVRDEMLLDMPQSLSFEEAATLPGASLTAMNAVCYSPIGIGPGSTVLTQGTGGVSCAAIQIATALGATVIATSSSDAKLDLAKKLGAKHAINYTATPDWASEVMKITNDKGVDLVVEVGGSGTIEQSLASVRTGGVIAIIGMLTPPASANLIPAIMAGSKILRGIGGAGSGEMLGKMLELFKEKSLHPLISKTFAWSDAPDAFRLLQSSTEAGKIVVTA